MRLTAILMCFAVAACSNTALLGAESPEHCPVAKLVSAVGELRQAGGDGSACCVAVSRMTDRCAQVLAGAVAAAVVKPTEVTNECSAESRSTASPAGPKDETVYRVQVVLRDPAQPPHTVRRVQVLTVGKRPATVHLPLKSDGKELLVEVQVVEHAARFPEHIAAPPQAIVQPPTPAQLIVRPCPPPCQPAQKCESLTAPATSSRPLPVSNSNSRQPIRVIEESEPEPLYIPDGGKVLIGGHIHYPPRKTSGGTNKFTCGSQACVETLRMAAQSEGCAKCEADKAACEKCGASSDACCAGDESCNAGDDRATASSDQSARWSYGSAWSPVVCCEEAEECLVIPAPPPISWPATFGMPVEPAHPWLPSPSDLPVIAPLPVVLPPATIAPPAPGQQNQQEKLKLLAPQAEAEERLKTNIEEALSYIPGIKVGVHVELDPQVHRFHREVKFHPQTVAVESATYSKDRSRHWWGIEANQSEAKDEQRNLASHEETVTIEQPRAIKRAQASIAIPRSYIYAIHASRSAAGHSLDPHHDARQVEAEVKQSVENAAVQLLPWVPPGTDPYPLVQVSVYDDDLIEVQAVPEVADFPPVAPEPPHLTSRPAPQQSSSGSSFLSTAARVLVRTAVVAWSMGLLVGLSVLVVAFRKRAHG